MRLVIQKVLEASVSVQGTQISKIGRGFLVLLGITHDDNNDTVEKYVDQVLKLRAWPSIKPPVQDKAQNNQNDQEEEKVSQDTKMVPLWNNEGPGSTMVDNDYEIIVVSQFTLYGKVKGNRPEFHQALNSEEAVSLYGKFVDLLKKNYKADKVQTGKFGHKSAIHIVNDGPTTYIIDSKE